MSRPAPERLARLLALVPWVAAHDGPEVAEVCRRFGLDEEELHADLELLFLCGVHPFTPDTLIEVDVADGRVWIRYADWFRRPLRLTPPEGLALVGAAAALLAVPGADPHGALARAVAKLGAVLGWDADAVDVDLGAARPAVLDTLRAAVEGRRVVEIDHYSAGRDERRTRAVQPWRVANLGGHWYLEGWCEVAGGRRLFRVDRISAARPLDREAPPAPAAAEPPAVFAPAPTDPLVVLDLAPAAHWVAGQYPNEGVERHGDVLRVRLRSAGPAWLERLLLRAGPDARVVEGAEGVAAAAAGRVLARYR